MADPDWHHDLLTNLIDQRYLSPGLFREGGGGKITGVLGGSYHDQRDFLNHLPE